MPVSRYLDMCTHLQTWLAPSPSASTDTTCLVGSVFPLCDLSILRAPSIVGSVGMTPVCTVEPIVIVGAEESVAVNVTFVVAFGVGSIGKVLIVVGFSITTRCFNMDTATGTG